MKKTLVLFILALFYFGVMQYQKAESHCDTKIGPVITAAKEALTKGDVNLILVWVQPKDEQQIRTAFQRTLEVRKSGVKVQEMADNYFFETLVRIHRAGEGVPYSGIKEDAEIELSIKAADEALEKGSINEVQKLLLGVITNGVNKKFNDMMALKKYNKDNVSEGREFVEKYVVFMHYVEGIYNTAMSVGGEHHSGVATHEQHLEKTVEVESKETWTNHYEGESSEHLTHILIISGTLLIIFVQILLSRKKTAK